ncbi:MAG: hypothetical protein AABW92_03290 [Nanoarchaeota archaeon]
MGDKQLTVIIGEVGFKKWLLEKEELLPFLEKHNLEDTFKKYAVVNKRGDFYSFDETGLYSFPGRSDFEASDYSKEIELIAGSFHPTIDVLANMFPTWFGHLKSKEPEAQKYEEMWLNYAITAFIKPDISLRDTVLVVDATKAARLLSALEYEGVTTQLYK